MVTHGLASTYRHKRYACRCDLCRRAHRERWLLERDERARLLRLDPSAAPHGSRSTYTNWGCRCVPCAQANKEWCAAYAARRKATR